MSSTPLGREVIDIGPQELGRWTDFVARFVFSHEDDGVTQVWLDGNLVVDRVGMPNHYNSANGPYLKLGFYKSDWLQSPSDVVSRTIYLDAIRVYEGADGYARVDPANAVSYGNGTRKLISIVVAGLLAVALVVFAGRRRRSGSHGAAGAHIDEASDAGAIGHGPDVHTPTARGDSVENAELSEAGEFAGEPLPRAGGADSPRGTRAGRP